MSATFSHASPRMLPASRAERALLRTPLDSAAAEQPLRPTRQSRLGETRPSGCSRMTGTDERQRRLHRKQTPLRERRLRCARRLGEQRCLYPRRILHRHAQVQRRHCVQDFSIAWHRIVCVIRGGSKVLLTRALWPQPRQRSDEYAARSRPQVQYAAGSCTASASDASAAGGRLLPRLHCRDNGVHLFGHVERVQIRPSAQSQNK